MYTYSGLLEILSQMRLQADALKSNSDSLVRKQGEALEREGKSLTRKFARIASIADRHVSFQYALDNFDKIWS